MGQPILEPVIPFQNRIALLLGSGTRQGSQSGRNIYIYSTYDLLVPGGLLPVNALRANVKGQRLHVVGKIGKKLSKLVFILYFEF